MTQIKTPAKKAAPPEDQNPVFLEEPGGHTSQISQKVGNHPEEKDPHDHQDAHVENGDSVQEVPKGGEGTGGRSRGPLGGPGPSSP